MWSCNDVGENPSHQSAEQKQLRLEEGVAKQTDEQANKQYQSTQWPREGGRWNKQAIGL